MRDLTFSSQSWAVSNEKQKMQHNFSIDLAERFHNLILKFINPRWIFTITEEAKINTKVLRLEGVTKSSLKRFLSKSLTCLRNFTSRPHGIAHNTIHCPAVYKKTNCVKGLAL